MELPEGAHQGYDGRGHLAEAVAMLLGGPPRYEKGINPDRRVVDEDTPVEFSDIDAPRLLRGNRSDSLLERERNADILCEMIEGSHGQDAQRYVRAFNGRRRCADGAVPAPGHESVEPEAARPRVARNLTKCIGAAFSRYHLDGCRDAVDIEGAFHCLDRPGRSGCTVEKDENLHSTRRGFEGRGRWRSAASSSLNCAGLTRIG
jgi:hypothetical protein